MKKLLTLILALVILSGCASQVQEQAEGISKEALARTSAGSAVTVDVTFLNPVQKNEEELVFKVALDTHSVDLLGFKIDKLSTLRNSEGIEVKEGFVWTPESESSHHRSGYLKVPAKINGTPLISEKTEYIVLEIRGIETNREFKWEKDVLQAMKR